MLSPSDLPPNDSGNGRRFLIAAGTACYQNLPETHQLPAVRDDIRQIVDLFTRKLYYQHVLPELGSDPRSEHLQFALSQWFTDSARSALDIVVLYYSGHGAVSLRGNAHYLFMHHSDMHNLPGTAFPTMNIARILEDSESPIQQLLVILDTCNAGLGTQQLVSGLQNTVNQITGNRAGFYAMAATLAKQEARQNIFASTFVRAVNEAGQAKIDLPYLDPIGLLDYINPNLPEGQKLITTVAGTSASPVFIPNPSYPTLTSRGQDIARENFERELRLRKIMANHSGLIRDLLDNFQGRTHELDDISQRIAALRALGGYLAVTGQPGQGKSSVIAKLVDKHGSDNTAFHFVPLNPGPDHRVKLLRDLMARLILKYNLDEWYVASDSLSILHDFFAKILKEVTVRGAQEVIFLDGLDQLAEGSNSTPGLTTFLPKDPPPGIVFVLGMRLNDAASRQLSMLSPHYEVYELPNLSRQDFTRMLRYHQLPVDQKLTNQLYQDTRKNSLYLGLIAKEMLQSKERWAIFIDGLDELPEEESKGSPGLNSWLASLSPNVTLVLTTQHNGEQGLLSYNPENLFALSIARLQQPLPEWQEVIKLLLGLLLIAREPLGARDIQDILHLDDDRFQRGITRLDWLIIQDGQQRYTLFHQELRDYLRQDSQRPEKQYVFTKQEEEHLHDNMVEWCERGGISFVWEEVQGKPGERRRREYARRHYITHLYHAGKWQSLFAVLDKGTYGQAKLRYDVSTRAYAQDLDLGRQAAAWEGWAVEDGLALLPRLWQYTLLRCSLANRADQYPLAAFHLLLLLQQEAQAMDLAELLTQPSYKVQVLLLIARHLANKQSAWKPECVQLLMRTSEVIRSMEAPEKDAALSELGAAFAEAELWGQSEEEIQSIADDPERAEALRKLGAALDQIHLRGRAETLWAQAAEIVHRMEDGAEKVRALRDLVNTLIDAQLWRWAQAEIETIGDSYQRAGALRDLGNALTGEEQWDDAEAVITTIEDPSEKARALRGLGIALIRASLKSRAATIWQQAKKAAQDIEDTFQKTEVLRELGTTFAEIHRRSDAQATWRGHKEAVASLKSDSQKAWALRELGRALTMAGMKDQAQETWLEARVAVRSIGDSLQKAVAFRELGKALAQVQLDEQAAAVWLEAERALDAIKGHEEKDKALHELGRALAETQSWEQARRIVRSIVGSREKAEALRELGTALAGTPMKNEAGACWLEAEIAIHTIEEDNKESGQRGQEPDIALPPMKAEMLHELGRAFAHAKFWEQAKGVMRSIEDPGEQTEALCELGEILIKAHEWGPAKKEVLSIEDRTQKVEMLSKLGMELAEAKLLPQAEEVWVEIEGLIRTAEDSIQRAWELVELGSALARVQKRELAEAQWAKAEGIARSIENYKKKEKDTILHKLGRVLVGAQSWEWAERVMHAIEDRNKRVRALGELWRALVRSHLWEQSETIWTETIDPQKLVEGSFQRAWEVRGQRTALFSPQLWRQDKTAGHTQKVEFHDLRKEADVLATSGNNEQLLRFVQSQLTEAETRKDAFNLLAVASEFLPLEPEIGESFYQAFNWVDAFLKKGREP